MLNSKRTLVIGLDGASWRVLEPLINRGILPNLNRIRQQGSWTYLESTKPPVTCPAWKCYSTGKNPGKLGVFWWVNFDKQQKKLIAPNQFSFNSKDVWDYFGENGMKVAVINMPTTYPPKKVNGLMISGFGAPLDKKFNFDQPYTYPNDLQLELEKKYNYQVGIKKLNPKDKIKNFNTISQFIKTRFNLLMDLLAEEKHDLIHFTIFYINVLQHFYGSDKVVHDAWKIIDRYLGRIMNEHPHINIFIMSDHGSVDVEKSFFVNNWLKNNGYLSIKKDFFNKIGWVINKLDKFTQLLLNKKLFSGVLHGLLPNNFTNQHPGIFGLITTNNIDSIIEWDKSKAVALSQGPLYLNHENINESKEPLINKLVTQLKSIRDPHTDEFIIEHVWRSNEIYNGPYVHKAPDLIIIPKDGIEIYGGYGGSLFQTQNHPWTSGNHPKGIFCAWGIDISQKGKINNKNITDISPTVMALHQIPIPTDMDGQVMKDIFRHDIKYQTVQPETRTDQTDMNNDEQKVVKKRLEELGYLG